MFEKKKHTLKKGKHVGVVFIDLSKTFDTINHYWLITKLQAFEFSEIALLFILNCLKNRFQRATWPTMNTVGHI